MSALVHRIRVRTSNWAQNLSLQQLESLANQINDKAQGRRMLGQISGVGLNDGKTRIHLASHVVLPTARVRGSSILVDIEVIAESGQGRTVAAFIESGLPIRGILRGVMFGWGDMRVHGVDLDLNTQDPEETVLDDIVDALDASDN
jgi:hypothetical protein